ncbi:hypothetical protein ACHAXR_007603 [Thalassiosira sp. AJA248-18]
MTMQSNESNNDQQKKDGTKPNGSPSIIEPVELAAGNDGDVQPGKNRGARNQHKATEPTGVNTIISVPTKTNDGGTIRSNTTDESVRHDAFSHYSDDAVRMRTLFGQEIEEAEAEDQDVNREDDIGNGEEENPTIRKTRLSFEAHAGALLERWFGLR